MARNPENAGRILRALKRFGAPVSQLSTADFTEPDNVIQFGVPPNRIDILTTIDGVAFEEAWPNRVEATYGGVPIFIISKADLITNKRASGRPQDLLDLARLLDD
ncbi:MAG: hypothetical protein SF028_01225 [Candidatus Sumerlaeia bacterium]|nr:hypothetical protein [Candidatus Sumerlaeia bacterium]